jgi:trans-aconitate methyltransferase
VAREAATTKMTDRYTFGDNDLAAARLALLAEVYKPTTRQLLTEFAAVSVDVAVDLGCGPGHSTELLHATVGAGATWGLDASKRLIERARARVGASIGFAIHDVTTSPLPIGGIDLAYARHLLAHLADPRAVLTACASASRSGGRLVLEETAALDSSEPVFVEYYACVREMLRHYGQNMFIGSSLERLAQATPWRVERFERISVPLDARTMATLHAMNVRTWSQDAFAASSFDARTMGAMTENLDAIASGDREVPPVAGVLGQAVLRLDGVCHPGW